MSSNILEFQIKLKEFYDIVLEQKIDNRLIDLIKYFTKKNYNIINSFNTLHKIIVKNNINNSGTAFIILEEKYKYWNARNRNFLFKQLCSLIIFGSSVIIKYYLLKKYSLLLTASSTIYFIFNCFDNNSIEYLELIKAINNLIYITKDETFNKNINYKN